MKTVIGQGVLDGERVEIVRVFNKDSDIFVDLKDGRTELIDFINLLQWVL